MAKTRAAKRYVKAAIGLGNLGLAYNMWDFDLATEDFEPDQRASLS